MRLVRDPTIRIFKPRYTAAVTTMVVQPATAPGNAPENPGIKTPITGFCTFRAKCRRSRDRKIWTSVPVCLYN